MALMKEKLALECLKVQQELQGLKDNTSASVDSNDDAIELAAADDEAFNEEDNEEEVVGPKCNWPTCIIVGAINLPPELCGTCKKCYLHHACQIAAEEEVGYSSDGCKNTCYLCHNDFKKIMCGV